MCTQPYSNRQPPRPTDQPWLPPCTVPIRPGGAGPGPAPAANHPYVYMCCFSRPPTTVYISLPALFSSHSGSGNSRHGWGWALRVVAALVVCDGAVMYTLTGAGAGAVLLPCTSHSLSPSKAQQGVKPLGMGGDGRHAWSRLRLCVTASRCTRGQVRVHVLVYAHREPPRYRFNAIRLFLLLPTSALPF